MASKSFTLADGGESGGGAPRNKCCMYSCVFVFIIVLVGAGVYFYQNSSTCSCPDLDEYGLSNWTYGTDNIVFSCFPGYFLDGEADLVASKCQDGDWDRMPPSCNALPLRIDCHVDNNSLSGDITMWQETAHSPTYIYGLINYTLAVIPQGHVMEHIVVSKKTCNVSHEIPENPSGLLYPHPHHNAKPKREATTPVPTTTTPIPIVSSTTTQSPNGDDQGKLLKIHFSNASLKAFKKAEVFMNIIFVDSKTTATLVSVHQEQLTFVMPSSEFSQLGNSSLDKATKAILRKLMS